MYQVAPEETDDNEGAKMAVIWDFEPTTGMTGAAIQPEEKPADHMVSVPRLAFDEVSCNCTQFPGVGDIVRTPDTGAIAARLQNLDLSGIPDACGDTDDENDKESEEEGTRDESNSEAEEELFTELMQLKGSSYHDSFQSSLEKCKERLLEKEKIDLRLQFEPTNVRDENAIVVQASLSAGEGGWQSIGYIPAVKVPKVTIAMRKREVRLVTLKTVFYQFVFDIGQKKYFPAISVSKIGRWPPNKKDYKYNDKI